MLIVNWKACKTLAAKPRPRPSVLSQDHDMCGRSMAGQ